MSGNGVDLDAMDQAILKAAADLRTVAGDVRAQGAKPTDLDGKTDGLRQAVTAYHAAVPGHGVPIFELDARVRRLEQRLDLPPAA